MLPRESRLTDGAGFRETTRHGRRAGRRSLVVHLAPAAGAASGGGGDADAGPARVGLVVSRAVGGSVVRTQVKRRLRHLLRSRLQVLPADALVVVRALAPSATMSSVELARDLDRCLSRLGVVTGVAVSSAPTPASSVAPEPATTGSDPMTPSPVRLSPARLSPESP